MLVLSLSFFFSLHFIVDSLILFPLCYNVLGFFIFNNMSSFAAHTTHLFRVFFNIYIRSLDIVILVLLFLISYLIIPTSALYLSLVLIDQNEGSF